MKPENIRNFVNPSYQDLISTTVIYRGREYIPLSPTKRVYIQPDELMRKHDKRVAYELELWEKTHLE